jgi:protein subunit release factor B
MGSGLKTHDITDRQQESWRRRLATLGLRDDEFDELFTHSGGRGGQNVNKTSTAVVLSHRPTGLQVRCEAERSQAANRALAREWLLDKIDQQRKAAAAAERDARERVRRQSRPRPRVVKQRILETKARHSLKKRRRQRAFDE